MANNAPLDSLLRQLAYPESPRWRDGLLWFSDVHNFRLKACDLNGRLQVDMAVEERPAGLGFMPDGRLLMATALGKRLHFVADGKLQLAADLSGLTRGLLNDMLVDDAGRAYVGDTGYDLGAGEPPRPGQIFLFEEGKGTRCVAQDVNFPNGMALTPDGQTLYVAETFAKKITAFSVAPGGDLIERRDHALLNGTPDGICLDEEGTLWVATLTGGAFVRLDKRGQTIDSIDVSPANSVACMLGGEGRNTLFLCFANVENDGSGGLRREGFIRAVKAPASGAGLP